MVFELFMWENSIFVLHLHMLVVICIDLVGCGVPFVSKL